MKARVAILEQIARNTEAGLAELRVEMRVFRSEAHTEIRDLCSAQAWDCRWVAAGMTALLGVMAHDFHWV